MSKIFKSKEENWKDIEGYEGLYQVSDLGRVKSFHYGRERILKLSEDTHGYLRCGLNKDNKQRMLRVHQLIASAFLNHKPNGNKIVVDHLNNVRTDNRLSNLQLITNRENTSKDKTGGSSEYVGVYWNKHAKKWKAHIVVDGKQKYLGYFQEEIDAHNAYQEALKKIEEL